MIDCYRVFMKKKIILLNKCNILYGKKSTAYIAKQLT